MIDPRNFADSYQPDFGIDWVNPKSDEELALMSTPQLAKYAQARKYAEQRAEQNPVGAGWVLPSWRMVMDAWKKYPIIVILGGQRSSKSTFASKLCVWCAATIPQAEIRAYHVNEDRSIEDQQRFIWDALPMPIKTLPTKKGTYHSVQYSQKNGFTDNVCILPPLPNARRGGTIKFGNYRQYQQDAQVTEGFKAHCVWCIAAGELVQMADGTLKPIERVCAGEKVLTMDGVGKPVIREVLAAQANGKKECLQLRSKNGTPVTCTPDHEVFWGYNYKSKKEASEVHKVAQIRPGSWWPEETDQRPDAWYVWGALVTAEGYVAQRKVTNGCVEVMEKAVKLLPTEASVRRFDFNARHKHVPDWYLNWDSFWEEYPVGKSEDKEIPSWVFKAPKEKARLFLRWLYFGDGWASGNRIGYATTSYRLSIQLVTLLNRLGIRSNWSIRAGKGEWKRQYNVNISKADEVIEFISQIGIEGKEVAVSKVLVEANRRMASKKTRSLRMVVNGNSEHWTKRNKDNLKRFSRVTSREEVGLRKVYDLTVEDTHRFLTGTALVSNCDEEVPPKMFETLVYRTTDYHGRVILTFTTLSGWTPLIQDILGKTRTLVRRHSSLMKMDLPIMQESISRPGAAIFYFWTEDNHFIDTQDFMKKIRGRSRDEILARAHGIPTKSISGAFPAFNREVNVVDHEKLPWIKNPEYPVTRYMAIDPAGSKNWFMLWVAVDADGTWWVYREWPDYDDWALPGSSAEGKPGPAQKGSKKGIKDYVDLIHAMENGETIFERFIDPRLGAAEKQAMDGAVTIISQLDEQEMSVIPAPGVDIDNGLQLIGDKLAYEESSPISSTNAPHLYVSDRCANFIFAMQEYTAKGGKDEAAKDPVDCLRYIAVSNPGYYENQKPDKSNRTGVY